MTVEATGELAVAKRKKSEVRRHGGMTRIDLGVLERARLAASLMRMSLADYVTEVVRKAAEQDINREAKKLAKGPKGKGAE